jgi:site-specific DNA-methyltransferase (adenine-specific)
MSEVKLYQGDCAKVMADFPPDCIDLTVTSPPYDNLRTYNGYVFDFEAIAAQLWRVTKPGGVVVWVVGDATINGSETGTSFRQALEFLRLGFNLHDTMIYDKNGFRFPFPNRYHQVFEYMFVLHKPGPGLVFNPIDDRKCAWADTHPKGHYKREADGSITKRNGRYAPTGRMGRRYNIWRYSGANAQSEDHSSDDDSHPAVFPEALARDHILSWSNPGDTVLDPMMGSGTTGKMAVNYQRDFIGIEISAEYLAIAEKRIAHAQLQIRMEI